jgi:hypothetical protein
MTQQFTSAKTSINSKKLPAIYNRLNWDKLRADSPPIPVVLDIGAGKHVTHIQNFLQSKGFIYAPYDPFNLPDSINNLSLSLIPSVVICSNVFNVIKEKDIIYKIHQSIKDKKCPFFITVYEGDRSYIGHPTMNNTSYQRNEELHAYMHSDEVVYKQTLTLPVYQNYLK